VTLTFPHTIHDWNSLPSDQSLHQTVDSFKSYLTDQLPAQPRLHGILCAAVHWSFHDVDFNWKT